jgi:hypothetical protein
MNVEVGLFGHQRLGLIIGQSGRTFEGAGRDTRGRHEHARVLAGLGWAMKVSPHSISAQARHGALPRELLARRVIRRGHVPGALARDGGNFGRSLRSALNDVVSA